MRENPPDLINPHRPPLDVARTARALRLAVEPVGPGEFRVSNGVEDNYVTLRPYFNCDCGDAVFREVICKHLIAALLWMKDPAALKAAEAARRKLEAEAAAREEKHSARTAARAQPEREKAGGRAVRAAARRRATEMGDPAATAVKDDDPICVPPPKPQLPVETVELGEWW